QLFQQFSIAVVNKDIAVGLECTIDTFYMPIIVGPIAIGRKIFWIANDRHFYGACSTPFFVPYKKRMDTFFDIRKIRIILIIGKLIVQRKFIFPLPKICSTDSYAIVIGNIRNSYIILCYVW